VKIARYILQNGLKFRAFRTLTEALSTPRMSAGTSKALKCHTPEGIHMLQARLLGKEEKAVRL
jgi:hypothetical protein